MRFEEAYSGWQAGRLRQEEAARLLGVCERSFRRYIDRYEEAGLQGLIDRRMSQISHRRALVDEVMALTTGYQERHEGRSAKHYYSWYRPGRRGAQLFLGAAPAAEGGAGDEGSQARGAPQAARSGTACRDAAAPGRERS